MSAAVDASATGTLRPAVGAGEEGVVDRAAPAAVLPVVGATPAARAAAWAALPDEEQRRLAIAAAQSRDPAALWAITEAALILHGAQGARLSPATLATYRRAIAVLAADWSGQHLLRPGRAAGSAWLRAMEAAGVAPATVTVRLAAARWLYRALRLAGATGADPFADVRAAPDRTPAHEKRGATAPAELEALLRAASAPRDRALVLLAGHAGLRAAELVALRWEDVDLAGRRLVVVAGKGGKRRGVGLSRSLAEALLEIRPPEAGGPVLDLPSRFAAWRRLRALAERAGVPARGLHALRHTAGTRLYRERRDLALVAAHLGHAGLETARIYAKLAEQDVQQAVADW